MIDANMSESDGPPKTGPVRPRPAASLVMLRGTRILLGRRPHSARFMPGVHVFPGGVIESCDGALAALLPGTGSGSHDAARIAALRETWEETGLMIGRAGAVPVLSSDDAVARPMIAAYAHAGLAPAPDKLSYIARAITPEESPIRFDTFFFLADGADVSGTARPSAELPDVLWMEAEAALAADSLKGVTKFVLREALRHRREGGVIHCYTWKNGREVIRREPDPAP